MHCRDLQEPPVHRYQHAVAKGSESGIPASDVLSKLELLFPDKIRIPLCLRTEQIKVTPRGKAESFIGKEVSPPKPKLNREIGDLEPSEKAIIDALTGEEGLHPDTVISRTGLDAGEVMSSLTVLELYGIIAEDKSGKYFLV